MKSISNAECDSLFIEMIRTYNSFMSCNSNCGCPNDANGHTVHVAWYDVVLGREFIDLTAGRRADEKRYLKSRAKARRPYGGWA
jgi:hypothetical protein